MRKLAEITEENKFSKDLILGLNTPSTIKSGPFPTSSTPKYVDVNLQDLVVAAAGKLSEQVGLEDIPITSPVVAKQDGGEIGVTQTADETPTA